MAQEIEVRYKGWVITYTVGGQYADIGHVDANCSAVECINYIEGDGTKIIPDRKRLRNDLKSWVDEVGDHYYREMQFYL